MEQLRERWILFHTGTAVLKMQNKAAFAPDTDAARRRALICVALQRRIRCERGLSLSRYFYFVSNVHVD